LPATAFAKLAVAHHHEDALFAPVDLSCEREAQAQTQAVTERASAGLDARDGFVIGMNSEGRTRLIEVIELAFGKKAAVRERHAVTDARMPFGQNEDVPISPLRLLRIHFQEVVVKSHHHLHHREAPADVSAAD